MTKSVHQLKEFPTKEWTKRSINRLLQKSKEKLVEVNCFQNHPKLTEENSRLSRKTCRMVSKIVLENGYVRFTALSLFFLLGKFYAYWCTNNKVIANDKVGRFLSHSVVLSAARPILLVLLRW